jgi:hypothetical protein
VSETEEPSRLLGPMARVTAGRGTLGDDIETGDLAESGDGDQEPRADFAQQVEWLRRNQVSVASVTLIVVSLIWKAEFLSHYFFRQDDFAAYDRGLNSGLTLGYLFHIDSGHLFPGVYLISWILARVALYNWAAAVTVELALIAGASVAAWRLLRTLMGNRLALLIPLVLYLVSPLAFPTYSWWITAIEAVPLQIAVFMALNWHVRYVWTGRLRFAWYSAAWQLFGLFFFEKAVVIPLLLFAITVGFLTSRRFLPGLRATVVRLWRGWVLYLGLAVIYGAFFLIDLSNASGEHTSMSAPMHTLNAYTSKLFLADLLPGALGGPWHWYHQANSAGAYAAALTDVGWLAVAVVLVIVAATILVRRRAWWAWAILLGWVVVADMIPVVVGRLGDRVYWGYGSLFGMETRYVADVPAVLAIVVALAFWPLVGPERKGDAPTKRKDFFTGRWKLVGLGLVAVIVVGSIWSVQRFQTVTNIRTVISNQDYIENANAALADTPAGTVIVNSQVPSYVMVGLFGKSSDTSVVLAPLSHRGSHVTWTNQASGTIANLKIFGGDGRLWPAALSGSTTGKIATWRSCITSTRPRLILHFQPVSVAWANTLRVGYIAESGAVGQVIEVYYGQKVGTFTVQPGIHKVYLPVHGSAASVVLQGRGGFAGLCFAPAVAGYVVGFPGSPIPSIGS